MSGHSKWSTIKRQKGVADTRRGQIFTRLSREITLAARQGGPNVEANARLRLAIQKAKDSRMPSENIERAVKKAAGGEEGVNLIELLVEGYGPGGVAIIVEVVTDNRNRTVQDLRTAFVRGGGNLAESGAVSWLFEQKGIILIDVPNREKGEEIALLAIDTGAEDVKPEQDLVEIHTQPAKLEAVRQALEAQGLAIASAEVSRLPKVVVRIEEKDAIAAMKLLDKLEEMPDVQKLYSNMDFSEEVLEIYQKTL